MFEESKYLRKKATDPKPAEPAHLKSATRKEKRSVRETKRGEFRERTRRGLTNESSIEFSNEFPLLRGHSSGVPVEDVPGKGRKPQRETSQFWNRE